MSRNTDQRTDGYDPVALAPPKAQKRYAKLAVRAATQPRAATKLGCLSCCCWDYGEAKRCEIRSCAHWALNRRIFKGGRSP